ncbi:MAG: peroxide stress protein YaaA [Gammaproteobacteria bacterium]|nr:peroxide stress protein YaaA [Gammaproteobacteria bacterium]MCY4358809.1 peroxide stress protein YaaA [Gammaproteobacteria bacterium]
MIIVLSPAKSLDFESRQTKRKFTQPVFLERSAKLVNALRKLRPADLSSLMQISDSLAQTNFERYAAWHTPFNLKNARQAIFAFKGDVYLGLKAEDFSSADLDYAQKHLRILSGLYGILKPLDLMQPYRLEMGRQFAAEGASTLYEFWGSTLTESLNTELATQARNSKVLVNLASNEYFNSLQSKAIQAEIVSPRFMDWASGKYRVISFFAKKARGEMAAWIIRNRLRKPDQLNAFDVDGYRFDASESTATKPVFKRKQ